MNKVLSLSSILCLFILNALCPEAFFVNVKASGSKKKSQLRKIASNQLEEKNMQIGQPVFMRIFKKQKTLELWMKNGKKFNLFKKYNICHFSGKLGPKEEQGDHQAPEGFYSINHRSLNPFSRFHLSFNIGHPNKLDQKLKRTGDYIMVHGGCVSIGCFAMTDEIIEEIYFIVESALRNGQESIQVHSFPFYFSEKEFSEYKDNKWLSFWRNLEQINNAFEQKRIPPRIRIKNNEYTL